MSTRATELISLQARARTMSEQRQFHMSTIVPTQWSNGRPKPENKNNNNNDDFTPSPRSDTSYSTSFPDMFYARMTSPYFEYTTTRRTTQRIMDGFISPSGSPIDTFTFVEDTFNNDDEFYSEFTTNHHTSRRLSDDAVYEETIRITTQIIERYSDDTSGSIYSRGRDSPWNYPYEDYPFSPHSRPVSSWSPLPPLSIRELTPTPTPRSGREFAVQDSVDRILPIDRRIQENGSGPLVLMNHPLPNTEMSSSLSPKDRSPKPQDESLQPSPGIVMECKTIPKKITRLGSVCVMDTIEEETEPSLSLVSSLSNISIHESAEELTDIYTNCKQHEETRPSVLSKESTDTECNIPEEKSNMNSAQRQFTDMSTVCNLYEEMSVECLRKKSIEKATNCNFLEGERKVRDSGKMMIDKFTNCNFYEEQNKKASARENATDLHMRSLDDVTIATTRSSVRKNINVAKCKGKGKGGAPERQTLPPLKGVPRKLNSDHRQHVEGSRSAETNVFYPCSLPTSDRHSVVEEWLATMHEDKRQHSRPESETLISEENNRRLKRDNTTLPTISRPSACRLKQVQRCYDPRKSSSENASNRACNIPKLPPIKSNSISNKPTSSFLPSPPKTQRGSARRSRHPKAASKPEWKF